VIVNPALHSAANTALLEKKLREAKDAASKSQMLVRVLKNGSLSITPQVITKKEEAALGTILTQKEVDDCPYFQNAIKAAMGYGLPDGVCTVEDINLNGIACRMIFNRMFFHTAHDGLPLVSVFFTLPSSIPVDHLVCRTLPVRGDPHDESDQMPPNFKVKVWMDRATDQLFSGMLCVACIPKGEINASRLSVLALIMGPIDSGGNMLPHGEYIARLTVKAQLCTQLAKDVQETLQKTLKIGRRNRVSSEMIGGAVESSMRKMVELSQAKPTRSSRRQKR
jgi:hypothetical protein